jgi:hypothetical protein
MTQGFDSPQNCSAKAEAIRAAGFRFVARYYFDIVSHAKTKLTRAEAEALSVAGLYVVAVYENGPDHPGYFSHSKGVSDGTAAFRYAADQIDQPLSSPIYFAVDYDASGADLNGGIADYFRGLSDAFAAESDGAETYPLGVYGSGLACSRLTTSGAVTFAWLAQASGWSGFHTFTAWNLKQGPTQGHGGGFQVALVEA